MSLHAIRGHPSSASPRLAVTLRFPLEIPRLCTFSVACRHLRNGICSRVTRTCRCGLCYVHTGALRADRERIVNDSVADRRWIGNGSVADWKRIGNGSQTSRIRNVNESQTKHNGYLLDYHRIVYWLRRIAKGIANKSHKRLANESQRNRY